MIHARQIKAARALLDWSQDDLATATGLSVATIYNLEKGNISPRSATNTVILQALEDAGLEFEANGVRLRNDNIRTIEGVDSCDVFFEDVMQTVREKGGDVVCGFRASPLMEAIYSIKRSDYERMEKLGEITAIKCLVAELPKALPTTPSLEIRTASKVNIGAVSFIEYGNKHAFVMVDGTANFTFKIFNSAGMTRMYREHFLLAWELSLPLLLPSNTPEIRVSA